MDKNMNKNRPPLKNERKHISTLKQKNEISVTLYIF